MSTRWVRSLIVVLTCLFESFPFLVAALYIVVHDSKICALVSIGVTVAWITLHKSRRVLFGSLFVKLFCQVALRISVPCDF